MPITLADASVGRADKVSQEVIDTLHRGSMFMDISIHTLRVEGDSKNIQE